jgi:hypothetical protein
MLDFGGLEQDLVEDRRLASDHVGVVEWRDEADRTLRGEFECVGLRVVVRRAMLDELDVVVAKLLHLRPGRVGGHDDGGANAKDLRGIGDPEAVITRRGGDHRAAGIRAMSGVDGGERPSNLERTGGLETLQFRQHRSTPKRDRHCRRRDEMVTNDPPRGFKLFCGWGQNVANHHL